MNCSEVIEKLDDYLDHPDANSGGDADRQAADIALHVQGCQACATELERRQMLRDDLRALPVPISAEDFFGRALARAEAEVADTARHHGRADPSGGWQPHSGLIGLAAALLIAVALGVVLRSPEQAPEPGLPSIYLATDTVTPVKLAFSAEKALENARLSVSLPVGVELMGYDGRSDLSWSTDLEAGTNVLRLPLVGRMAATDLLVARLDHPTGSKTFRLQVTVNESGAPDDD